MLEHMDDPDFNSPVAQTESESVSVQPEAQNTGGDLILISEKKLNLSLSHILYFNFGSYKFYFILYFNLIFYLHYMLLL